MKVFLLFSREEHTGSDTLLGVYSTREKLGEAVKSTTFFDGSLVAYSALIDLPATMTELGISEF